jgi:MFS family permease
VLGLVFFAGTFGLNFQITSALMATEVFDKGPEEFGLLGSFLAVGSLAGSLLAARRTEIRQRLVVGAAIAFGLSVMLAGLMPSYLTFALLAPVTGLTALTFITSANTYMQLHTDAGVRGRVMALYMMIFMGGTPVGAPIIGWIGHEYGARWTLLGGGLMTIVGVVLSAMMYLRLERARHDRAADGDEAVRDGVRTAPAAF